MQSAAHKFVCRPSARRLRQMAESSVDPLIRSALRDLADAYDEEERARRR